MLRTTLLMVGAAAVVSAQVSFGLFASCRMWRARRNGAFGQSGVYVGEGYLGSRFMSGQTRLSRLYPSPARDLTKTVTDP